MAWCPCRSVPRLPFKKGGPLTGKRLLAVFMRDRLSKYGSERKEPHLRHQSFLSAWIHFGHISVVEIAIKVKLPVLTTLCLSQESPIRVVFLMFGQVRGMKTKNRQDLDKFLDELIVQRELGVNFVHYNAHYTTYEGLPQWARETLEKHASDPRPHTYTLQQLERSETADPYWNGANNEMVRGPCHEARGRNKDAELMSCPSGLYGDDAQLPSDVLGEAGEALNLEMKGHGRQAILLLTVLVADHHVGAGPSRGVPDRPVSEQQVLPRWKVKNSARSYTLSVGAGTK
jgi:hypothetical protein